MKKELANFVHDRIVSGDTYTVGGNVYSWATLTGASGSTHITRRCVPAHMIGNTPMDCDDTNKGYAVILPGSTTQERNNFGFEEDQDIEVVLMARFGDTTTLQDMGKFVQYAVLDSTMLRARYNETIYPWFVKVIRVLPGALNVDTETERFSMSLTVQFRNILNGG